MLRAQADARGIFLSDEVISFVLSRFSRDLSSLVQLLDLLVERLGVHLGGLLEDSIGDAGFHELQFRFAGWSKTTGPTLNSRPKKAAIPQN